MEVWAAAGRWLNAKCCGCVQGAYGGGGGYPQQQGGYPQQPNYYGGYPQQPNYYQQPQYVQQPSNNNGMLEGCLVSKPSVLHIRWHKSAAVSHHVNTMLIDSRNFIS